MRPGLCFNRLLDDSKIVIFTPFPPNPHPPVSTFWKLLLYNLQKQLLTMNLLFSLCIYLQNCECTGYFSSSRYENVNITIFKDYPALNLMRQHIVRPYWRNFWWAGLNVKILWHFDLIYNTIFMCEYLYIEPGPSEVTSVGSFAFKDMSVTPGFATQV